MSTTSSSTSVSSHEAHRRRRQRNAPPGYLLSSESFQQLLARERMRTDRTGSPFCVLTFRLVTSDGRHHQIDRLSGLLAGWLRFTDQCGFLGDNAIAAFLPDTPPEGGIKVLADLRHEYEGQGPTLECDAYVYPGQALPIDEAALQARIRPAATLYERPHAKWTRLMDLVVGSGVLVASLPVLGIAAAAIRLTSPGPVIFCQWRAGRAGRPFRMYKLRTMRNDAEQQQEMLRPMSEQDGPAFKLTNDPRVTPVGRFLRRTSIDELPQLWNVLRGEMSLVGPRPLPLGEQEACLPWQQHRLDVLPGLTGLWQVEGRSEVSFDVWMRMDRRYVRSQSFWNDFRLLCATLPAVLLRRGAK